MSRKRRNTSSSEDTDSPPPKRRSSSALIELIEDAVHDPPTADEKPSLNQNFGQVNAFPGLGSNDDELFYGPAADGIEYLRMVRSEAKGVPDVLVATTTTNRPQAETAQDAQDGDAISEAEVFCFDGTYTARAVTISNTEATPPAQLRYYESLKAQFHLLQTTLRCQPPMELLGALDGRPITFPSESKVARNTWEKYILERDPHPIQIASMDMDTVFELVRFLTRKLQHLLQGRTEEEHARVGSWVWAVLGKCPHPGEMDGEEISELRSLAQKASSAIRRGSEGAQHVVDEDYDSHSNDDEEMQQSIAVATDGAASEDQSPEWKVGTVWSMRNMLADMIVTVVGEVYGQRDLLEERQVWKSA